MKYKRQLEQMIESLSSFFARGAKWWKLPLAVLITFVWLLLWYFPWQANLHHIFWLQLGVGLGIFIVPGFCVYGLLSDRPQLEFNHLTFGFVISHLIFALLGTTGRFIHLSFESITFLMMVLGLILILVYVLTKVRRENKFQMDRERWSYILATLPILLVSLPVILIVIQRTLSDDDLTYLAYVTNWQHSTHLDFNDLIFGESQLVHLRFWLMSASFAQAFLAEISKVPGILILGGYYEPFLVILSVLCWYELAIALKLSPWAASASVILQLSFLLLQSEYLHPGAPYFRQLSVDKATAAFILAPVFFQSLILLLETPTRNNTLLLLLTGLSLTLMHPVMLAYSVAIGGMFILLHGDRRVLGNKWIPLTILLLIMIPQMVIRFAKVPAMQSVSSFDPEVVLNQSSSDNLIARWGNTRYYGFNLNILTMQIPYEANIPLPEPILKWSWLIIPIAAVCLALKQMDRPIAQFTIACFILCVLTAFPLTGWIIGYFLNGRMLARSVWLFPFGLSAVYLLTILRDKIKAGSHSATVKRKALSLALPLGILTVFSLGIFLLFLRENSLPNFGEFTLKSIRYRDLATAGESLDQLIPGKAVVIGSPNLNDLIPGISWKSQLVTFRIQLPSSMIYFTSTEIDARISATQEIFSPSTSAEDKMFLLRKYNVHFLLLQRRDLKLFNDLIARYPDQIKATEIGGVYLVQIN